MVQFGQFLFALLSGTVRCSIPHPTQRSNPIRSNPFVAASLRWFICVVQVKAMVQGRDRRPELGYKLALECRRNINYPMKNKNSKYVINFTNTNKYTIIHSKTNTRLSSNINCEEQKQQVFIHVIINNINIVTSNINYLGKGKTNFHLSHEEEGQ